MGANGRCDYPRNAASLTVPPHCRQFRSPELRNRIIPALSPSVYRRSEFAKTVRGRRYRKIGTAAVSSGGTFPKPHISSTEDQQNSPNGLLPDGAYPGTLNKPRDLVPQRYHATQQLRQQADGR